MFLLNEHDPNCFSLLNLGGLGGDGAPRCGGGGGHASASYLVDETGTRGVCRSNDVL